jgi:hypothetical protein
MPSNKKVAAHAVGERKCLIGRKNLATGVLVHSEMTLTTCYGLTQDLYPTRHIPCQTASSATAAILLHPSKTWQVHSAFKIINALAQRRLHATALLRLLIRSVGPCPPQHQGIRIVSHSCNIIIVFAAECHSCQHIVEAAG